jgi:HD superfamily phosphohydrolase YqeK
MLIKEEIYTICRKNIGREGREELLNFIENSDYFTAPASTKFHGTNIGDLAVHSLSVYKLLVRKNKDYNLGYSDETITICGLFHDICKVNFYKSKDDEPATDAQLRYLHGLSGGTFDGQQLTKAYASQLIEHYKNKGTHDTAPIPEKTWEVDDKLPLGHGEKSIYLLQKYINLTDEEALAMRWHMVAFDPGIHFNYPSGFCFRQAADTVPLVVALFTADYESDKLLKV